MERCAELEDLTFRRNQVVTHRGRHADSDLRMVRTERTMMSGFDRIGREQLSPDRPVTCLRTSESLQRKSTERKHG
jgi:hypothetical protein